MNFWTQELRRGDFWTGISQCNILRKDTRRSIWNLRKGSMGCEVKFLSLLSLLHMPRLMALFPLCAKTCQSQPQGGSRVRIRPVDEVVSNIVELLDEAIPNLPDKK